MEHLDSAWKTALGALVVPPTTPLVGAERPVCSLEVIASLVIFAADLLAPVEIQIALVAMSENSGENIIVPTNLKSKEITGKLCMLHFSGY